MPVHQLQPNPWNLYDMHGNVWEWVEDWYADNYSKEPAVDPSGPAKGDRRVRRGGSFESSFDNCRSAARKSWEPGRGSRDLGFRIVEVLN
ncbi:MAG TPA: SUMF1/EgtB/PvdO family nonheme iron enzyme [Thermoanaerobaculia bacterium]|jgi:formylglycine-generating enzyme required for sulfatase activity|nr:SUMF1/EgtB/PvdO family nonheme iron enzyme [Thermoanaerobaculia bacterium]